MSETENKASDPLATARKRFRLASEAMEENRERAEEADKFSAGLEQWPEALRKEREEDKRPCLTMDETNQYINQVKNDQRQNKAAVKVRPVDDRADKKTAEMMQGIVRNIEDNSNADIAYDTGFENALRGGYGYWRVITRYEDEESFNQELAIERIPNRFSVVLDPNHQSPDGSDSEWGFVVEMMTHDEYERAYPEAEKIDWKHDQKDSEGWITEDKVRIADYYFAEYTPKTIYQMPDGEVVEESELEGVDLTGLNKRTTYTRKIIWQKINGKDVLEETEWMGKFVPIVEVVGNESIIDGKRRLTGIVHNAMDAQRMHNFAISAMVENVALAPKSANVAAVGQLEGFENTWAEANRRNIPVLTYHPVSVDGVVVPPPQRQPMPGISQGWAEITMQSRQWVQASMGMYNASVGAPSNEKSGKAILARQREGDVGSFHYHDNLARSIRHTGRILIDLIPKIYDTKRIIRILGEDGTPETVILDPQMQRPSMEAKQQDGSVLMLYNPTIGKYDVTVSVGPSYSTKRQEAAEAQTQMIQAAPQLMQVMGDIMLRNMDWPGSDQMADRLKAMLPPQIQELENKNNKDGMEAKAAQLQQAEQVLMQKAETLFQKEKELEQVALSIQDAGQNTAAEQQKLEALKSEMEKLQAEIANESQLLAEKKARISAEIKLAQANQPEESDSEIRVYEADKSYQSELVKAAAEIIKAQIAQEGQETEEPGEIETPEGPDLQMVMQRLDQAVQAMCAPKRVVFDTEGNPVGVETVLQ